MNHTAIFSTLTGRSLGALLSPGGRRGRLAILTYHRILPTSDAVVAGAMERSTFEMQMQSLKDGFRVLPLLEAAARLADGTLPRRAASITFDDGYADNFSIALPILQSFGLPATFFVATDFVDGGRMWNDTVIEAIRRASKGRIDLTAAGLGVHEIRNDADRGRLIEHALAGLKYRPSAERDSRVAAIAQVIDKELPDDLMMTADQLRRLRAAGMEIGAHTMSHPILSRVPNATAEAEIAGSRKALEETVGGPIRAFAYPNGRPGIDYDSRHVEIVRRAGFEVAVSTVRGCACGGSDPLQLPRIGAWDRTPFRFSLRVLSAYGWRRGETTAIGGTDAGPEDRP